MQDIDVGAEIGVMCGRCHSLARVSLQRRDEDEWRKLAHTHVGQWTSIEYSASGTRPAVVADRQRSAAGQARGAVSLLHRRVDEWKSRPVRDLSGRWVVVGHVPGGKDFYGTARLDRDAGGDYKAHYQLSDVAGFEFAGDSQAIVYTGYEWRGSAQVGDRALREVYAVSDDGNRITGRWFEEDHAEEGGEWTAVREGGRRRCWRCCRGRLRTGTTTAWSSWAAG